MRLDFSPATSKLALVASSNLPQRQLLVTQTVAFLQTHIQNGKWHDWLPAERALCEHLQVSRNTLRAALAQLKKAGQIRPVHGSGNQILANVPRRTTRRASRDVALLSPEPIERLRPNQSLWIDDMRALLSEREIRLRVFHGQHYYGANPGLALDRLVTRNAHACWILMLASEAAQRWFSRNGIPCILAGSPYPDVDLPFRDLDHRATCRHAAGMLLGLGHRRIAMITQKSPRAGDLESEAGFTEGVHGSRHAGAEAVVVYHEDNVGSVAHALRRTLAMHPAPTALMVVQPHYYLAVATRLAQSGVRIPQDVSILSRDNDPFLSFMAPEPTRYVAGPHAMAKSFLRPLLELLQGDPVTQRRLLIVPEFFRGESVAGRRP